MAANNVLGIIFSNSYGEVIPELTSLRTMGSVPFAGRYRLIDFPLSDMVNAGIPQVGVITNSNYRSLMDHIGNGKPWDLARKREGLTILPPFSLPETGMLKGKIDALYGSISYISDSGKDYVILADTNNIFSIDFEKLLDYNAEKNADITFVCKKGIPAGIRGATEYIADENGKVVDFRFIDDFTKPANFSLKTMVIRRTLLERFLHEAKAKRIPDFETLFSQNINNVNMYCYEQDGYVKVIESVVSYYEANMDFLKPEIRKTIFTSDKPVYTKTSDSVPTFYGINATVENSLIADGCKIEGEVENSILFRGVTVEKGAKVRNSIIMQDTVIGENADIECVITDKDVTVRKGKKLCGASNYPVYIGKGIII